MSDDIALRRLTGESWTRYVLSREATRILVEIPETDESASFSSLLDVTGEGWRNRWSERRSTTEQNGRIYRLYDGPDGRKLVVESEFSERFPLRSVESAFHSLHKLYPKGG